MAELSLMASSAFSLAPFFHEQATSRASKDVSTTFLCYGNRQDILKSTSLLAGSPPVEEKWLYMNLLPTYNLPQRSIPMVEKHALIDVQGTCPDAVLFSFGIAEQCARREKILKFLFNGPNEDEVMDSSFLSHLMRLKTAAIDIFDMLSLYKIGEDDTDHLLHLARKLHIPIPRLEFVEDSSHNSNIIVHPDGQMLLTGADYEIKDLLSVAAEFKMAKSFTTSNNQTMVVPYFTRSRGGYVRTKSQGSVSSTQIVAPSKSPESNNLKPSPKKKGKNASTEREFYEKNYFRACEHLLSVIVDKKRNSTAVLSLKKSGPEIAQLLSQCAAGIAGTGLAILLSVAWKSGNGRVSLNAAKALNTGIGIWLLYLSGSVASLRDTVSNISRSNKKHKFTEEEIVARVDKSINAVLYRAAALVAITLLRFA